MGLERVSAIHVDWVEGDPQEQCDFNENLWRDDLPVRIYANHLLTRLLFQRAVDIY